MDSYPVALRNSFVESALIVAARGLPLSPISLAISVGIPADKAAIVADAWMGRRDVQDQLAVGMEKIRERQAREGLRGGRLDTSSRDGLIQAAADLVDEDVAPAVQVRALELIARLQGMVKHVPAPEMDEVEPSAPEAERLARIASEYADA